MSLILIQQKARDLRAKTRQELLATLIVPLITLFLYLFCIKEVPALGQTPHLLFAVALIWGLLGLYFLNRRDLSEVIAAEAGFSSGLEFCRRELNGQRENEIRVLLWSLGPVILAIAALIFTLMIVAESGLLSKAMPLLTLVVLWIVFYFVIWVQKRRTLQRETNELGEIEENTGQ